MFCFLIFAILIIGSVSANDENMTDVLESEDEALVEAISQDDFNSSDSNFEFESGDVLRLENDCEDECLSLTKDDVLSGYKITFGSEGKINLDSDNYIHIDFPNNVKVDSTFYFYIDSKLYHKNTISYAGDSHSIDVKDISCGKHTYKLVYTTNKNQKITKSGNFNVDWYRFELGSSYFECSPLKRIYQGEPYRNSIALPDDAKSNVEVIVNNKSYYFGFKNYDNIIIPDLPLGTHEILFKYSDSKYNLEKTAKDLVEVYTKINVSEPISLLNNTTFSLKLPEDAKGQLVVHVDGIEYNSSFTNGVANFTLPILSMGVHKIFARYSGDDYDVEPFGGNKYWGDYFIEDTCVGARVIVPNQMMLGDDEYITFELPEDANGNLIIKIDDKIMDAEFNNGSSRLLINNLSLGKHIISIVYSDDKYPNFDETFEIFVNCRNDDIKISLPAEIISKTTTVFTFTGPKDCIATVILYVGQTRYESSFKNGVAKISLKAPGEGVQTIWYRYSFENDGIWRSFKINSLPRPIIQNKNYKKDGIDELFDTINDVYIFRILNSNGKPVKSGEKVSITFYDSTTGKKIATKNLKTDKNGYIKLKLTFLKFDAYTAKINYKGVILSRKVTYAGILTFDFMRSNGAFKYDKYGIPVGIKKSSKKVAFKAILYGVTSKHKWQYIPNKYVIFKFNGKTYKVKTNSKGIAKLTLSKSAIKKLKVGKKYSLKITYGRDVDITKFKIYK